MLKNSYKYNIVNLEQDKSNQELITYLKEYEKQNELKKLEDQHKQQ